jgi:hypothetical protein
MWIITVRVKNLLGPLPNLHGIIGRYCSLLLDSNEDLFGYVLQPHLYLDVYTLPLQ